MTDEAGYDLRVGKTFAGHGSTKHGKGQYVSKNDPTIHTNTIEGYFSIFKRGMKGVYQHASKKHTAIWRSSTSATPTGSRWVLTTKPALFGRCKA